ncbi:MAG TPA: DUF2243 domain-containing protein [Segetibacter sp.]|jgi:uncharacterized membrane protein
MKKFLTVFLFLNTVSVAVFACPFCNGEISQGIHNSTFYPNLLTMLSAFIVLAIIVAILTVASNKRHAKRINNNGATSALSPVPLTTASIVLGIGLGGFIDGIFLHQVLQWHEMLSNKIPPSTYVAKSINMFWDGVFHAFCFIVVLIGVVLLWKLIKRKDIDTSGRLFGGGLLSGWSLFNIVEGIIDHHILKLHNVLEYTADHDVANFSFLGGSVVMLIVSYFIVKKKSVNNNFNQL